MLLLINPYTADVLNLARHNKGDSPETIRQDFVNYIRAGWRPAGDRSQQVAAAVLVADFARSLGNSQDPRHG